MDDMMGFLALIPDWLAGIGIFFLAIAVALSIHLAITRAVLVATHGRASYLGSLYMRIRRIVGLALILLAVNFAAQLSFFPEDFGAVTGKLLSVAVILLAGWAASIAVDVAGSLYLRKYQNDVADTMLARKHFTQVRVLRRTIDVLIGVITIAVALMAFEPVRQFGVSLFASAGAAGLVVGLAARPVLSNLIAGIQLAVTQPIKIDDAVIVEGEWGWIEEITSTYVVIKIWDLRRLIVPLSYFMEKPFQNWTRDSQDLIGVVYLHTDHFVPIEALRTRLNEVVQESKIWDGKVVNLQVTEVNATSVQLRMLASARSSAEAWDLRCEVREKMLTFLQERYPASLPRQRLEVADPPHVDGALDPRGRPAPT